MKRNLQTPLRSHLASMIHIRETERLWHFPVLAGLCIGVCLFAGWYFENQPYGNLASIGALTILYFTHASLEKRMVHLIVCAFGMIVAFSTSLLFSFNPYWSVFSLFLIAVLTHWLCGYFDIPPPRNFFFIMVAAVATNLTFSLELLPVRIGVFALGAMVSVFLAFVYSVFIAKATVHIPRVKPRRNRYTITAESLILGVAVSLALLLGYAVDPQSPYWIPVSTLAILQGRNLTHTTERNTHRVLGTFIGIGLTWLLILLKPEPLALVFLIALLQVIIELLVVRNYFFAVIFITPLTILLAETSLGSGVSHNALIWARFLDSLMGACIGLAAGAILHHKGFMARFEKQLRLLKLYRKFQEHQRH
ncbi:FUSC family protein [Chryseobacterium sp. A321]